MTITDTPSPRDADTSKKENKEAEKSKTSLIKQLKCKILWDEEPVKLAVNI